MTKYLVLFSLQIYENQSPYRRWNYNTSNKNITISDFSPCVNIYIYLTTNDYYYEYTYTYNIQCMQIYPTYFHVKIINKENNKYF